MEDAKNRAFDSRILMNDKMKNLIEDLDLGSKATERKKELQKKAEIRNNVQIIMDEAEDEP
jgi:hypothetical protein